MSVRPFARSLASSPPPDKFCASARSSVLSLAGGRASEPASDRATERASRQTVAVPLLRAPYSGTPYLPLAVRPSARSLARSLPSPRASERTDPGRPCVRPLARSLAPPQKNLARPLARPSARSLARSLAPPSASERADRLWLSVRPLARSLALPPRKNLARPLVRPSARSLAPQRASERASEPTDRGRPLTKGPLLRNP